MRSCAVLPAFYCQTASFLSTWEIAYTRYSRIGRKRTDFRGIHLLEAIADYQRRERRYGGLNKRQESDEAPIPDSFLVPR